MKTIITADIGGTHSRFAKFQVDEAGHLSFINDLWIETQAAKSFDEILEDLRKEGFDIFAMEAEAVVLAAPGPVQGKTHANFANVSWSIDIVPLEERLPRARIFLINDFVAQAYACRTEAVKDAKVVHPGQIDYDLTLAAIGAGTGLGYSVLKPNGRGGYVHIASEAGHASFPFVGKREYEYQDFLLKKTGNPFIFGDHVLSGAGLSHLHEFLTGEKLTAEEVAIKIDESSETSKWYALFYGRACRNFAFTVAALGGVYIAGGVAAKNPFLVMSKSFLTEFLNTVVYQDMLAKIPVYLNDNEDSGLWGAAYYGQLQLGR